MPFQERLGAFAGKRLDEDRARVRQRHHEQRHLRLLAGQPDRRFAEVDLGLARRMRQRQEHLLVRLLPRADRVLDDRLAAGEAVLVPQPLEDPLGRVPLLLRRLPVVLQDLVDDRQERLELRLRPRLACADSPAARRAPGSSSASASPDRTSRQAARLLNSPVSTRRRTSFPNSMSDRTPGPPCELGENRG